MRRNPFVAAGAAVADGIQWLKGYRFGTTPALNRLIYDSGCTFGAAAVAYGYGALFLRRGMPVVFLCAALAPLLNWRLGIYTRARIGAGPTKALRVGGAVAATTVAAMVASQPSSPVVLLWGMLALAPLVLPRLLLNLNVRARRPSFLANAVQSRGPVLLVGGAGYIGTHVIAELLAANHRVRVLDRLIYGKRPLEEFVDDPRFELVEGDVTDIVKLVQATKDASAVVHLAGLVGDPACAVDETFTRHANVIATRMAKEVALSMGVSRFVFASSCSVYGATDERVCEEDALNPVSLYARTKIDSERELLQCRHESFEPTILRFATVFGHSRRPRFDLVANLFTAQAMNDGVITVTGERQWRPFIHVHDLARAIVMALKADRRLTRGQIFNVGDSRINMTIGQLADVVSEVVEKARPVRIVRRPDVSDPRNYVVSFDKIKSVLGFEASISMRDGVHEMVREFQAGTYGDYRAPSYSNLEMTKQALSDFLDPVQSARLYAPMAEAPALRRRVSNGVGPNVVAVRKNGSSAPPYRRTGHDGAPPRAPGASTPHVELP